MLSPLERAIQLAVKAHNGQTDKEDSSQPAILHVMEVYHRVHAMFSGMYAPAPKLARYTEEEVEVAAILHDTVEDSKKNPTALEVVDLDRVEREFGTMVREIVESVTRIDGQFYRDHIYLAKANEGGRLVKIADNGTNRERAAKIKQAKWRNKLEYKYLVSSRVLNDIDEPTWEQAGASYENFDGGPHGHFFIPDPNGKKIEVSEEEYRTATARHPGQKSVNHA